MKDFKENLKDEKLISKVIPDAESEAPFADLLKFLAESPAVQQETSFLKITGNSSFPIK